MNININLTSKKFIIFFFLFWLLTVLIFLFLIVVLKVDDASTHRLGWVLVGDIFLSIGTFLLAVTLLLSKIITEYSRKIDKEKRKEKINKKTDTFKDELRLLLVGISTILLLFFCYSYVEASVDKVFNFIGEEIFGYKNKKEEKIVLSSPSPSFLPKASVDSLISPVPSSQAKVLENLVPVVDPDPVVNCSIHVNCGGGTMSLKSSECRNSTCCQIGDKWYFYRDKNKCTQDQKATAQQNFNNSNNRIPVVLPHNGLTYYCDSTMTQSIKDASTNLQTALNRQSDCLNQVDSNIKNCVNTCKSYTLEGCSYENYRATFGYLSYDDCVTKRTQESTKCIDDCYQNQITTLQRNLCYSSVDPYIHSLNDLLNNYCK